MSKKPESISARLEKFLIKEFESSPPKNKPKDFGYGLNIDRKYHADKHLFIVLIEVVIKKSPSSKKEYCKIITETQYSIKPSKIKKLDQLPLDARIRLILSAYSATRGALIAKNDNNFLGKEPLPLMDIESLEKFEQSKSQSK